MKQVIPFKKDIIFKTKISDITSISLEHTLESKDDTVCGNFILSGDYKMTEASLNRESFYYKLPFDIALDSRYDTSKLKIEIEDFYYEIINSDVLRVNIEVSIDGLEEKFDMEEENTNEEIENENEKEVTILDIDDDAFKNIEDKIDSLQEELIRNHEHINKLDEQLFEEINDEEDFTNEINIKEDKEVEIEDSIPSMPSIQNSIINVKSEDIDMIEKDTINNLDTKEIKSLFSNLSEEETFSTYHVYILRSEDSIESIMTKYNITKEVLSQYNDIDNIKLGDKIIIPAKIDD